MYFIDIFFHILFWICYILFVIFYFIVFYIIFLYFNVLYLIILYYNLFIFYLFIKFEYFSYEVGWTAPFFKKSLYLNNSSSFFIRLFCANSIALKIMDRIIVHSNGHEIRLSWATKCLRKQTESTTQPLLHHFWLFRTCCIRTCFFKVITRFL